MLLNCVDCPNGFMMEDDAVRLAMGEGTVSEHPGPFGTRTYFGVCPDCQRKHQRAAPKVTVDDEFRQLRQLMAVAREQHPEWSLEECSHEAVEVLNSPSRERDPGFRAWLLHRDL